MGLPHLYLHNFILSQIICSKIKNLFKTQTNVIRNTMVDILSCLKCEENVHMFVIKKSGRTSIEV